MLSKFLNSKMAAHSKFHWDFHKENDYGYKWELLSSIYEQWRSEDLGCRIAIPKIIHQIWIGPKIPARYEKWRLSWRRMNPEFEYKLWDEKSILEFGLKNERAYLETQNYGAKSDIARYEILNRLGGIYVDTDFECLHPITDKFLKKSFFAGLIFDKEPILSNAMMGAAPGYLLMDLMVRETGIPQKTHNPDAIMNSVGPGKLTEVFFKNIKKLELDAIIFPSDYFYPWPNFIRFNERDRYTYATDTTVAIHHWEVSWLRRKINIEQLKKLSIFIKSIRI